MQNNICFETNHKQPNILDKTQLLQIFSNTEPHQQVSVVPLRYIQILSLADNQTQKLHLSPNVDDATHNESVATLRADSISCGDKHLHTDRTIKHKMH